MKHIRHYKNIIEPEIGDYVYCQDSEIRVSHFLEKGFGYCGVNKPVQYPEIGKLIGIDRAYPRWKKYLDDIFKLEFDILNFAGTPLTFNFDRKEIIFFSKNKEDVQIYIDTKKYNI